jgi:tRNA A37 methylthiotransferase MiaB
MSVDVLTFGCRLNAFESEVIAREAERAGLSDTVVINSCAVTNEAVAPVDPAAEARAAGCAHRRHRLRGADAAENVCRNGRGRSCRRQ